MIFTPIVEQRFLGTWRTEERVGDQSFLHLIKDRTNKAQFVVTFKSKATPRVLALDYWLCFVENIKCSGCLLGLQANGLSPENGRGPQDLKIVLPGPADSQEEGT